MRVEVHTHQPEVEAVMRQMAEVMAVTEQRAVLAEQRASEAIEASTRALLAIADNGPATVTVAPVVIPAPIVENRVDVATPVVQTTVVVPDVLSMRITEMPPAEATVVNDPKTGKAKTIKVK